MEAIYTFGYGNRKTNGELLVYLKGFGIKTLIDVRRSPRAWSDTWYGVKIRMSCEAEGVKYKWIPALGNTTKTAEWVPPNLEESQQAINQVAEIAQQGNVLLLCAELDHRSCHRTAVAQAIADKTKLPIEHLV